MAYFRLNLQIKDASNVLRSTQFYGLFQESFTVGDFNVFFYNLVGAVQPLIAGQIFRAWASVFVFLDESNTHAAEAGSDCENIGLLTFENSTYKQINPRAYNLPAVNKDKYPDGLLDLSDTDVATLTTLLAHGTDRASFQDPGGLVWDTATGGYLTMRENRRNARRKRSG